MEIQYAELALIVGLIMTALKIVEMIISKYFGLEKQVSNHLQAKLEEMKESEAQNADRIVKAITELHLDLIKEINKIK